MEVHRTIKVFIWILQIFGAEKTCSLATDAKNQETEDEYITALGDYRIPGYDIVFVVYQGDIIMPKKEYEEVYGERSTTRRKRYAEAVLWDTGATVPYRITGFNVTQRQMLNDAMDHWEKYTCLDFDEVSDEPSAMQYIEIKKGHVNNKGTIIHELGHAIGLRHEHQRSDRDEYLTIHEDNINKSRKADFKKLDLPDEMYRQEMPYDFHSVMHYGEHYFANKTKNGTKLVTMEPKKAYKHFREIMGNATGASYLDVKYLSSIYKCSAGCGEIKCPENAFLGKGCKCYCNLTSDLQNKESPVGRCLDERCEYRTEWLEMFDEMPFEDVDLDPGLPDRPHGYEMEMWCKYKDIKSEMNCDRGKWNDVPNCYGKCSVPTIQDAIIYAWPMMNVLYQDKKLDHGHEINVICTKGFVVANSESLEESKRLTCEGGHWDSRVSCKPRPCLLERREGTIYTTDDGRYDLNQAKDVTVDHDVSIKVRCHGNYTLPVVSSFFDIITSGAFIRGVLPGFIKCRYGTLLGTVACENKMKQMCRYPTTDDFLFRLFDDMTIVENVTSAPHGTYVFAECKKKNGTQREGTLSVLLECVDGSWDPGLPPCSPDYAKQEQDCTLSDDDDRYKFNGGKLKHGQKVKHRSLTKVQCAEENAYFYSNNDYYIWCQDGKFENFNGDCNRTCRSPTVQNAKIYVWPTMNLLYQGQAIAHGHMVYAVCDMASDTVGGTDTSNITTCIDGSWDQDIPPCSPNEVYNDVEKSVTAGSNKQNTDCTLPQDSKFRFNDGDIKPGDNVDHQSFTKIECVAENANLYFEDDHITGIVNMLCQDGDFINFNESLLSCNEDCTLPDNNIYKFNDGELGPSQKVVHLSYTKIECAEGKTSDYSNDKCIIVCKNGVFTNFNEEKLNCSKNLKEISKTNHVLWEDELENNGEISAIENEATVTTADGCQAPNVTAIVPVFLRKDHYSPQDELNGLTCGLGQLLRGDKVLVCQKNGTWKGTVSCVKIKNRYRIRVKTGRRRSAGTGGHVFLKLYGKYGESEEVELAQDMDNSSETFQEGDINVFDEELQDVGQIQNLRVRLVGVLQYWYLTSVAIFDYSRKQYYPFFCKSWVSKDVTLNPNRGRKDCGDRFSNAAFIKVPKKKRNGKPRDSVGCKLNCIAKDNDMCYAAVFDSKTKYCFWVDKEGFYSMAGPSQRRDFTKELYKRISCSLD